MSDPSRTFSFRAFAIGIASMVIMGLWIHFHEILAPQPAILAENSPPAGAVGVFVGVLLLSGALAKFRPALRLLKGELLVIYAMLVIAAPLMSQGMWHRFLGLVVAMPHNAENLPLMDAFSEKLWPHGPHLVADRRFAKGFSSDEVAEPAQRARIILVPKSQVGATSAIELFNTDESDSVLRIRIPRMRDGVEILVPGGRYLVTSLIRVSEFQSQSRLSLELVSETGERMPITSLNRDTPEIYSRPGGFQRVGQPYVSLPRNLGNHVDLVFTLSGVGKAAVTDVTFFSNESVACLYKGKSEIGESQLPLLPANSRDSLLVRPDDLKTPAGIWYALKGYIPYGEWSRPLFYWISIVLAMFIGLLGIGVIFRKQWADNERFSFPMLVLPRLLLEETDDGKQVFRPIFRSGAMKLGVLFGVLYCLMQGLAFYVPGLPDPTVSVNLASYFSSPPMKAYWVGFYNGDFTVYLMLVSIAFFVDLDMLLSILVCFAVVRLPFYFGETFGWKNISGPVDTFPFAQEQHIGAFLCLALIVFWTARRHLLGVGRRILGLEGGVDDANEAVSYRVALFFVIGSFVFFALWGSMTGLGAGTALLFFGFLVVCGLSASRIRTECGAPSTYFTPYFPYLIFVLFGGLLTFRMETMLLAYMAGGFMAVAQFLLFAPTQVEMLQLTETVKAKPRQMKWALIAGALGGLLIGGYFMLVWCYGKGGENIPMMKNWALSQNWYFRSLRYAVAQTDADMLNAAAKGTVATATYPTGPLIAVGVGGVITLLLTILRSQFVGFWIHPIGYILANTYFIYMCWGSILVAWAVKWVGLKIGGPRLIRDRMTPFFVGVFLGGILGMLFWDGLALMALSRGIREVFICWP